MADMITAAHLVAHGRIVRWTFSISIVKRPVRKVYRTVAATTNLLRRYLDDPFFDLLKVEDMAVHWRATIQIDGETYQVKGHIPAKDWLEWDSYKNVDCPIFPYVREHNDSADIYDKRTPQYLL